MDRKSFFRRLFTPARPATKTARRCRIAVESLEDRDVPATVYVHNGDDGAVGALTATDGGLEAPNLRSAVAHLDTGANTFVLDAGVTYHLTAAFGGELQINYPPPGSTSVSNSLTIEGSGGGVATIDRQGADQFRLFEVNGGGGTTLDHLRLTGGAATGFGGAVLNNAGGDLTITACTLDGNSSANGGGLANLGTAAISGSTVSYNRSFNFGGGIDNWGGGTLVITNSTIDLNQASGDGGGIDNRTALTLINCTIAGNATLLPPFVGGGMALESGVCVMNNTIVADNNVDGYPADIEGYADLAHSANNLIGTSNTNNFVNGSNGNVTDVPARLGPLAFNGGPTETQALLPGSPAINGGSNVLIPAGVTTDQRGFARVVGGTVDIGAFELNQAPTLALPAAVTAFEDAAQAILGITVGDPDGDALTVTLVAGHGTLILGTITGLSVSGGSGAVTLSGSVADLNAALATLSYRGSPNFAGTDWLSVTASDGQLSTSGTVVVSVVSAAEQAADLRAVVAGLRAAGDLTGGQATALTAKLSLQGNAGDAGRVQAFLNQVQALLDAGVLTLAEADALSAPGRTLLLSVSRR